MKKAFTLIELLVVIAIIAILAAILFPVFAQAKVSAKRTTDTMQVKQIGMAFQLYLTDNDGTYPPLLAYDPSRQSKPNNFGFHRWPWLIRDYTKSFEVFWSPAVGETDRFKNLDGTVMMNGYFFGMTPSWGYNQRTFSPEVPLGYAPINESRLEAPSSTLLLANSIWWTTPNDPRSGFYRIYPPEEWAGSEPLTGLSFGHVWPWHGETANVIFADLHVKGQRITQIAEVELWKAEKNQ